MSNIRHLFLFQLKMKIKSISIWSLIMFGIMSMYMFFFSTMQEMAQVKFEMLPTEYLQLVGVSDMAQMSNYVNFFGMILNILVIIISIYAITTGFNLILKEEKDKTIEYLYSLSVTRKQIYISKLLIGFLSIFTAVFAASIAGILFGYIVGDNTFDLVKMFSIIKITGFVPFFFLSLGLFMSALSTKHSSASLGCGIVMISYMLGYLGKILEDKADFLKYFSPFELLSPTNAESLSNETLIAFLIIIVISIILLILSSFTYKYRDYNL